MKITKDKLRQIVKEELTVLKENRFSRDAEEIKARLLRNWEENDQQGAETFIDPDEITAAVLEHYNYEWEDLSGIIKDAVKAYNETHEDKVSIEGDAVYDLLYREG